MNSLFGPVKHPLNDQSAADICARIYVRNRDPRDPFFESLTDVQADALYRLLKLFGMRMGKSRQNGIFHVPGKAEEDE